MYIFPYECAFMCMSLYLFAFDLPLCEHVCFCSHVLCVACVAACGIGFFGPYMFGGVSAYVCVAECVCASVEISLLCCVYTTCYCVCSRFGLDMHAFSYGAFCECVVVFVRVLVFIRVPRFCCARLREKPFSMFVYGNREKCSMYLLCFWY